MALVLLRLKEKKIRGSLKFTDACGTHIIVAFRKTTAFIKAGVSLLDDIIDFIVGVNKGQTI
jgi:hypothetical protein